MNKHSLLYFALISLMGCSSLRQSADMSATQPHREKPDIYLHGTFCGWDPYHNTFIAVKFCDNKTGAMICLDSHFDVDGWQVHTNQFTLAQICGNPGFLNANGDSCFEVIGSVYDSKFGDFPCQITLHESGEDWGRDYQLIREALATKTTALGLDILHKVDAEPPPVK